MRVRERTCCAEDVVCLQHVIVAPSAAHLAVEEEVVVVDVGCGVRVGREPEEEEAAAVQVAEVEAWISSWQSSRCGVTKASLVLVSCHHLYSVAIATSTTPRVQTCATVTTYLKQKLITRTPRKLCNCDCLIV